MSLAWRSARRGGGEGDWAESAPAVVREATKCSMSCEDSLVARSVRMAGAGSGGKVPSRWATSLSERSRREKRNVERSVSEASVGRVADTGVDALLGACIGGVRAMPDDCCAESTADNSRREGRSKSERAKVALQSTVPDAVPLSGAVCYA